MSLSLSNESTYLRKTKTSSCNEQIHSQTQSNVFQTLETNFKSQMKVYFHSKHLAHADCLLYEAMLLINLLSYV